MRFFHNVILSAQCLSFVFCYPDKKNILWAKQVQRRQICVLIPVLSSLGTCVVLGDVTFCAFGDFVIVLCHGN